ncbi:DUF3885 domain-containing protein [Alicyclobacillus fastidiosus]|uniref:DUF3885 domain-containing protein n=1 Tax=Alicyclobacillus fastidiosus TaxID=392011 RepID=UPI003D6738BE
MAQVYSRAHALFDVTHRPTDEIFLVVNAHRYDGTADFEKYDTNQSIRTQRA